MIVLGLRIQLALEQHSSPIHGTLVLGHPVETNILKQEGGKAIGQTIILN